MLSLKDKKILVTGGSGFLGSHVVEGLKRRGVPGSNIFVPRAKDFDLRKKEDCDKAVSGQDIIFDLAAVTGNILSRQEIPGQIFYDNLVMGVQLMEAARKSGVSKVISVGSAVEYPENAPSPLEEKNLWNGPLSSINVPSGLPKKMLLVQGQAYRAQYGFNVIHLILTNTFGPHEKVESGYLMPSLIQKLVNAQKYAQPFVEVWGTGETTRDFLYVDDAVEGILLAAELYDAKYPINLGTGTGTSIKDLVGLICRLTDYRGEIRWDPTKPQNQLHRVLKADEAFRQFGFRVKTSLEEGLRRTIEWHQAESH